MNEKSDRIAEIIEKNLKEKGKTLKGGRSLIVHLCLPERL